MAGRTSHCGYRRMHSRRTPGGEAAPAVARAAIQCPDRNMVRNHAFTPARSSGDNCGSMATATAWPYRGDGVAGMSTRRAEESRKAAGVA